MAIARGQITLVDLTDSINLQGFLTSSVSKTQFLSTEGTFNPSWTVAANQPVITAEMYEVGKANTNNNLINDKMVQKIQWYQTKGGARSEIISSTSGYSLINNSAGKPTQLKITSNVMDRNNPGLKIDCIISYKYNEAFPVQEYKLEIDYSLSVQGATGADGADSQHIIVNGEQVFKYTNNFSGTPTPANITLTATKINTTVTGKWQYLNGSTWTDCSTDASILNATTFNVSPTFGTLNGNGRSIRIRYIVGSIYDEITIVKVSDGAKGENGEAGKDAYTVVLTNENHSFSAENNGNISAVASTTTEAIAYKGASKITPTIGALPTVNGLTLSKNGAIITIQANTGTSLADSGSFDIPVTVDGKTFTKSFSWSKSKKGNAGSAGATGITVSLSKENVNIPCNQNGNPISSGWTNDTITTVKVYQGATLLSPTTAETLSNKQFKLSLGQATGCTAEITGANKDSVKLTNLTQDSGSVIINIEVKNEQGQVMTIQKNYTFVKSKAGINSKLLSLTASNDVFILNEDRSAILNGANSITLTANAQNLGGAFSWFYKKDNGTETAWSGPGSNGSATITWGTEPFAKSVRSLTIIVKRDGLVDSKTISALSDGFSPVLMDITTPNGYIFRNGDAGNNNDYLECVANLYKNGSEVAASNYRWHFQNPASSSGWTEITSEHIDEGFFTGTVNSKTLQVLSKAVLNIEIFKCIATYNGKDYTAFVSLTDLTDPYSTDLVALQGTTFKNGIGSTTVRCDTYNNYGLVDSSKLTYRWSLYNKNGEKVDAPGVSNATTQAVTVSANQINITGTLVCEVSDKNPNTGISLYYTAKDLDAMAVEEKEEVFLRVNSEGGPLRWKFRSIIAKN